MLDTNTIMKDSTTIMIDNEINSSVVTKASEYRKVIKPLLERRRRARINHCLSELKELLVDAYKSDISEPSKLEKADILELTVRHLRDLRQHQHRQQKRQRNNNDNNNNNEFRQGYIHCAHEVATCVATFPGFDSSLRTQLLQHLQQQQQPKPEPQQVEEVHHHHPSSSLTPPPSPVYHQRSTTPEMMNNVHHYQPQSPPPTPTAQVQVHHHVQQQRSSSGSPPAGYVSLAVLMSHKQQQQQQQQQKVESCWRPW